MNGLLIVSGCLWPGLSTLNTKLFRVNAKFTQKSLNFEFCDRYFFCQCPITRYTRLGNKFFGTRPNWAVSYIAYTKFYWPRPVFHLLGQISLALAGGRELVSQPVYKSVSQDSLLTIVMEFWRKYMYCKRGLKYFIPLHFKSLFSNKQ